MDRCIVAHGNNKKVGSLVVDRFKMGKIFAFPFRRVCHWKGKEAESEKRARQLSTHSTRFLAKTKRKLKTNNNQQATIKAVTMPPSQSHMEESTTSESEKRRRLDRDLSTSHESILGAGLPSDNLHECSKKATTEASAQGATSNTTIGTNSQWLFSREDDPQMVLRDNLGDTSAMVESLTHDVNNWSLTNLSSPLSSGTKSEKAYKQKCRQAKREVMRSMLKKNTDTNQ